MNDRSPDARHDAPDASTLDMTGEAMPFVDKETLNKVLSIAERFQAAEANRRTSLLTRNETATTSQPPGPELFDAAQLDPIVQAAAKHLRQIGRVNILVAGQTGVGKSTLINAVFGEHFAPVATGRPVTQKAEWYVSPRLPLRILDTKGLEAKDYQGTLRDLRSEIERARAKPDASDQLHLAWVCISAPSSRVQDAEIDIVRVLGKYDIPAVLVLTKHENDQAFVDAVESIMRERRINYASIVPVRALCDAEGRTKGLSDLSVATYSCLPQAHRAAFAASQRVNRDLNREVADECVEAGVATAGAAAVVPIPFADLLAISPIHAGMLLGICSAFGFTVDRGQTMKLAHLALGALAWSVAGRWFAGTTMKFIPGIGTSVGTVVNAGVVVSVTRRLGRNFVRFVYEFMEDHGRAPTADEMVSLFPPFHRDYE